MKKTNINEIIRAAYEPHMQYHYGMSFDEVATYIEEHGHVPPIAKGPFAGELGCGPFHIECHHRCKEHPVGK